MKDTRLWVGKYMSMVNVKLTNLFYNYNLWTTIIIYKNTIIYILSIWKVLIIYLYMKLNL